MKIIYRIATPTHANIPGTAKNGAELDRILYDYYQLGGDVNRLTIFPVVTLGTLGTQEFPPKNEQTDEK